MAPEKIEKLLQFAGLETLSQNRKDEEQKTTMKIVPNDQCLRKLKQIHSKVNQV